MSFCEEEAKYVVCSRERGVGGQCCFPTMEGADGCSRRVSAGL